MKIAKTRGVKTPIRGTSLSAGIDFFVPEFNNQFVVDLLSKNKLIKQTLERILEKREINLGPNERILIPSGIKVNFEGEPKVLIANNKSGVSTKKGLDVLANIVDQDYMGEVHISLVNTSNDVISISENEKIIQFLMVPVFYEELELVEDHKLWISETERGAGGFGSTNKN